MPRPKGSKNKAIVAETLTTAIIPENDLLLELNALKGDFNILKRENNSLKTENEELKAKLIQLEKDTDLWKKKFRNVQKRLTSLEDTGI